MNEKLGKLNRQRASAVKKLIATQHREKQLEHELKRPTLLAGQAVPDDKFISL